MGQKLPQLPDNTHLEIRQHQSRFYAILKHDDETLGMTGTFNSHTAAYLAGQTLLERYRLNVKASQGF